MEHYGGVDIRDLRNWEISYKVFAGEESINIWEALLDGACVYLQFVVYMTQTMLCQFPTRKIYL